MKPQVFLYLLIYKLNLLGWCGACVQQAAALSMTPCARFNTLSLQTVYNSPTSHCWRLLTAASARYQDVQISFAQISAPHHHDIYAADSSEVVAGQCGLGAGLVRNEVSIDPCYFLAGVQHTPLPPSTAQPSRLSQPGTGGNQENNIWRIQDQISRMREWAAGNSYFLW